jgi:TRAP-type C4-dicarboxylate transport system substrate-binding protein
LNKRTFLKYAASLPMITSPLITLAAEKTKEQQRQAKSAKYIFNFSSPYYSNNLLGTPHAHQELKQLIEKHTQHKVFVNIHDGGRDGIGSVLANKVKHGLTQGALLSVANLSPMIKALDLLNIPFWSAEAEQFLRLFNSNIWQEKILSQSLKYRIRVMMPYAVGARTATTLKSYNLTIKDPADLINIRFRVPGSANLKHFYHHAKAKPIDIPWALCGENARRGRFDALDPSIPGLYSGPDGLNQQVGIISQINSVHDGWVAIANNDFINSLDSKTQTQFIDAFSEIQLAQQQRYQQSQAYCQRAFLKAGSQIYTPTAAEKSTFVTAFGHQNKIWEQPKKRLLGKNCLSLFERFYQAAQG